MIKKLSNTNTMSMANFIKLEFGEKKSLIVGTNKPVWIRFILVSAYIGDIQIKKAPTQKILAKVARMLDLKNLTKIGD